jgi:hypothetical protein
MREMVYSMTKIQVVYKQANPGSSIRLYLITKKWPLRKLMGWGMLVKKDVQGGGTEAMDGVRLIWVLDLSFFWLIVDVVRCFRLELS